MGYEAVFLSPPERTNGDKPSTSKFEISSAAHALRANVLLGELPMNVILYTRMGCHLCDVAEQVLRDHGLAVQKIDIDENQSLREKFTNCVPVVEIDGKVRFRGTVDPVLLRRLLQSTEEQS